MKIKEFISNYKNYPVLFIGSGFSFRYLKETYTWDELLSKICEDLWGNDERYLDIKAKCLNSDGSCSYEKSASKIESLFNEALENDRDGKFKDINDIFYDNMRKGITLSRFKIYVAKLVNCKELKSESKIKKEIKELKLASKKISSIITTNYDRLIEEMLDFKPLVGNDILLSNPYGSVYKIHGCVDDISKIIITEDDYKQFDEKYELIRAQMLSLFIHNPIIFLGYNIGDDNIKKVLKTVFSYVEWNTPEANKVRENFLLVEYDKGSTNLEVTDHDIVIDGRSIRINKLRTDNFQALYRELASINIPISVMDIRKVETAVKDIRAGGSIRVMITDDLDDLKNSEKILAIGSSAHIELKYSFMTLSEMIVNYFKLIDESNSSLISLINKMTISASQYFPIYGFCSICGDIKNIDKLKSRQIKKLKKCLNGWEQHKNNHRTIQGVLKDPKIAASYKMQAIMYSVNKNKIKLDEVENYLRDILKDKKEVKTDTKQLLCLYDLKKYA